MLRSDAFLKRIVLITAFLCVVMRAVLAAAESDQALVLGGPIFPNGWMYDNNGKVAGLRLEFFGKIARHAGYKWRGKLFPAKRLMTNLVQGRVDVSMLVLNPMLNNPTLILTGKEPIYTENLNIYSPKYPSSVRFRTDLRGKQIVVMRGYGYGGFKDWLNDPQNQIQQVEVDGFDQAISMLIKRNLDYALLYDLNFEAGMADLEVQNRTDVLTQAKNLNVTNWAKVPVYFHLSRKALPDAEQILASLMQSFHTLQKEGSLAEVETMDFPTENP